MPQAGRTALPILIALGASAPEPYGSDSGDRLSESPLGFETRDLAGPCALSAYAAAGSFDAPPPVLVPVGVEELANNDAVDTALACLNKEVFKTLVRLEPPTDWQNAPNPYEAVDTWIQEADRFFQRHRGEVRSYQIGSRPDLTLSARSYAFLVKRIATLLRSVDPD